jgi:hypothetical protein
MSLQIWTSLTSSVQTFPFRNQIKPISLISSLSRGKVFTVAAKQIMWRLNSCPHTAAQVSFSWLACHSPQADFQTNPQRWTMMGRQSAGLWAVTCRSNVGWWFTQADGTWENTAHKKEIFNCMAIEKIHLAFTWLFLFWTYLYDPKKKFSSFYGLPFFFGTWRC